MTAARLFLARCVFWLFWTPYIVIRAPFLILAMFIDWLSWTVLPAFGAAWDHVEDGPYRGLVWLCNKIAGPVK